MFVMIVAKAAAGIPIILSMNIKIHGPNQHTSIVNLAAQQIGLPLQYHPLPTSGFAQKTKDLLSANEMLLR